jgi:DNA-binding NarL/FixJ family response regulator
MTIDNPLHRTGAEMPTQKALILHAEESQCKALEKVLGTDGFHCLTAVNNAQARRLLDRQPFDLLLVGICGAQSADLDFIHHVNAAYPHMAIVGIIDDADACGPAPEAGIHGYLFKPLKGCQLRIAVKHALWLATWASAEKKRRDELEQRIRERSDALLALQKQLQRMAKELKSNQRALERNQTALQTMMDCRQRDRTQTEETVLTNVRQAVEPYLQKLRRSNLTDRQRQYLDILESRLQDVVSPFIRALSSTYLSLSPTELQVAHLIKEGRNTKEIAAILNLSPNTIMTHRYKIRTKLGLKQQRKNLHVFLKSLSNQ